MTRQGYCENHKQTTNRDARLSAHQRGYTWQWRKASKAFLAEYPWCAECERHNRRTLAELVDHINPHKGDMDLFWDQSNWQPLCKRCHNKKTAREDGGFGNRRR